MLGQKIELEMIAEANMIVDVEILKKISCFAYYFFSPK